MKVYQLSKNNASLKSFILQFQLFLEFSQINEILSTYSETLLFLTKYSFLFENSSLETPSLKNTHTKFKSSFSSPDPARDGWNWWGYCAGNPVMNVDLNGLYLFQIESKYKMQDSIWARTKLKDTDDLIKDAGCAVTVGANLTYTISNLFGSHNNGYKDLTPKDINNKYVTKGDMNWTALAKDYGLNAYATRDERLATDKVRELLSDSEIHFLFVNVNYDSDKHDHWIGLKGATTIDGIDYYIVSQTSINDSAVDSKSLRGKQGWKSDDKGNILVPVSETKGYIDMSTKKNEKQEEKK